MTDLITTILTTAIEHAPGTTVVVAAYKAAQPFLARILGPGAEEIGEIGREYIKGRRAKNLARTLADADKQLADVGREAQEVPLTTLDPLLDAASLEADPTLAEKWAALLANAADSAHSTAITAGYVEILRQLTPAEARLLDKLFMSADKRFQDKGATSYSAGEKSIIRKRDATEELMLLDDIYCDHMQLAKKDFDEKLRQPFDAMLDNFVRQQIIVIANSVPNKTPFSSFNYKPDRSKAFFTSSGYDFMQAVTPPTL